MQACNRCKRDITDKRSGAVLHHHDVDTEHGTNEGNYDATDLCPRCYRAFVTLFSAWVRKKGARR